MIRTYRELCRLKTFRERFDYLKLQGAVGASTFAHDRYLNQVIYHSSLWRNLRDDIIVRDNGCDLAMPGYEITHKLVVHHMNPITLDQIEAEDDAIFDPNYLVCVSFNTHNAIHFGDESLLPKPLVTRRSGDTIPWR